MKSIPFILYKTTNLTNGKFYIGIHRQRNYLELDGYYGSGELLKRAMKKHGKENFKRETLAVLPTKQDAFELEEKYIALFLGNSNCYNIDKGGVGNIKENLKRLDPESLRNHYVNCGRKLGLKNKGKKHSLEVRLKFGHPNNDFAKANKGKKYKQHVEKRPGNMTGKVHRAVSCILCRKPSFVNLITRHYKNHHKEI